MGCDIHLFAEVRDAPGEPWRKVGRVFKNSGWGQEWFMKSRENAIARGVDPDLACIEEEGTEDEYTYISYLAEYRDEPYDGRNYSLFSILAGVRDYTGKVKPIVEPRGLPDDMSEELSKRLKVHWYHSESWYMLRELLDYDWKHEIFYQTGVITEDEFMVLRKDGKLPDGWCQATYGPGIEMIDEATYLETMGYPERDPKTTKLHIKCEWQVPAHEYVRDFIDVLNSLSEIYDPDNFRLVFGFDN